MNQEFKRGVIQTIEKGPTKDGKFGPVCTYKLTIDGKKFSLPFQDPNKPPAFFDGDTVQFMYEQKSFTNNEGKTFNYNEIDKKTFGLADKATQSSGGEYQSSYQQPARPAQTASNGFSSNDDRQVLIVAQSSLKEATAIVLHNNQQSNVTEELVITTMHKLANAVLNFKPNAMHENKFENDDVPY